MSRRYLRPGAIIGHVLVLAASLTCLRLGWWQWGVFSASGGTGQNLGYSLLWPVFAGAFIYMWLRFLQLEGTRDEQTDGSPADDSEAGLNLATPPVPTIDATEGRTTRSRHKFDSAEAHLVGIGYIDDDYEDDPELAAYNRALAQLADEDNNRVD